MSHVYLFANSYTVRLRVTDNEGAVKDVTKTVNVERPAKRPADGQLHGQPGLAEDARERDVQLHVDR